MTAERLSDAALDALFKAIDKDSTGTITLRELVRWMNTDAGIRLLSMTGVSHWGLATPFRCAATTSSSRGLVLGQVTGYWVDQVSKEGISYCCFYAPQPQQIPPRVSD